MSQLWGTSDSMNHSEEHTYFLAFIITIFDENLSQ